MERFLARCANYIYTRHAGELQHLKLVFPNRRAGVFFISYLQNEITNSTIGPETTTVGELISGYSDLMQGEKLHLISILYDVFKQHTHTTETFDDFYFWGEILLSDFNEIDRYLVNAHDLFRNVLDLKEIEQLFDYLTEEQKAAIEHFWGSIMVSDKKEFQKKHLLIWEKLFAVYSGFKEVLVQKNLAFGGMIDRQVIEKIHENSINFDFSKYYIIGLNALNGCEKEFFRHMQQVKKAEFLWDFDEFYLNDKNNGAGRFMRENLELFPPPADFEFNRLVFQQKKNIKLVAVSSHYGQSQQIPEFLAETRSDFEQKFDNTAIVLADESLLFSALGAIPPEIGTINVTMGYPVKNSMIYGFILLLANLVKNSKTVENKGVVAYHRFVTDILNHQLLVHENETESKAFVTEIQTKNRITVALNEINFSELHKIIFAVPQKVENYSPYFLEVLGNIYLKLKDSEQENNMLLEIIFAIYQSVEKLHFVIQNVLAEPNREFGSSVYFRLFSQYISNVSVAFEGEPLSGIQVMGILETRCLDFKNLIILGLNENKWPRTFTAPTFIPSNIRKGFGLPGIDEQDAMYTYYFYRLIQRAKNITATYSVVKEGIGTGELSRYGYQLQYDSMHRPANINLDFYFANDPAKPIRIKSSKAIVAKLLENNSTDHPLSPSAINIYLQCRLRFYFRYILGLPEPDEVKEEIDGMIFGNIFHDTMEALYSPYTGKILTRDEIEKIRKNKLQIENEIRKKIAKNYFREDENSGKPVILEGKSVLIYENIKTYLNQLLKLDAQIAPFTLVNLEKKYYSALNVKIGGQFTKIYVGGTIDRVDRVNGTTRILDYKTGTVKSLSFNQVEDLFKTEEKEPKKEILQALIYSWIYAENENQPAIKPIIYGLRQFFKTDFNPEIKMGKSDFYFGEIKEVFLQNLENLVTEIYSEENEFTQTHTVKSCAYCAYNEVCQRF